MSLLPFNVASCPICGISVILHKYGPNVLILLDYDLDISYVCHRTKSYNCVSLECVSRWISNTVSSLGKSTVLLNVELLNIPSLLDFEKNNPRKWH